MLSAVIASASIVVISLLFGIALMVAWWQFGLRRHVALWALSFMAGAVGHGFRISGGIWATKQEFFAMLACHASVAGFALLAWGFRARRDRTVRWVMVSWALSIVVLHLAWVTHRVDWRTDSRIVTAAADAVMLAIVVQTLRPARGAGLAAQWVLGIFGVYVASVGVAAWMARPGGDIPDTLFIAVLSVGTPTGMIGTGILTLLIVSADLANGWRQQARTDALTGLLNRRGLEEDVATARKKKRAAYPSVVAVADLDHFKAVNDRLGHAGGDEVLCAFARLLRASAAPGDLVARTGGEEFALLFAGTDIDEATRRLEGVRLAARQVTSMGDGFGVTASFGVTGLTSGESLTAALARADAALYQSKREGRDRITLEGAGAR